MVPLHSTSLAITDACRSKAVRDKGIENWYCMKVGKAIQINELRYNIAVLYAIMCAP